MNLKEFVQQHRKSHKYLYYEGGKWKALSKRPKKYEGIRESLAHFYKECAALLGGEKANEKVRALWQRKQVKRVLRNLPRVIADDGFLSHYARAIPITLHFADKFIADLKPSLSADSNPIELYWNNPEYRFYDVVGAPPGFLSKFFVSIRLKKDQELLNLISSDLAFIAQIEDDRKRRELTLGVLSHGAAYRELAGRPLLVPSFTERGKLISYICYQHLIADGVKTISLVPSKKEREAPGIYLCQGTEMWPSQPSMLGSLFANLGPHGSATAAYQHSWRRIHKHLRELKRGDILPYVTGHSMGGAMAMQIALYSHDLIHRAFAFNPPVPNERDWAFYQKLQEKKKAKLQIIANLDDFAFWRIGARVIGTVRLFLGKKRWRYFPINGWEVILVFPAAVKLCLCGALRKRGVYGE
ncbi:MAG: hypothetical protein ACKVOH_00460 [Chlamydiales bacterium]